MSSVSKSEKREKNDPYFVTCSENENYEIVRYLGSKWFCDVIYPSSSNKYEMFETFPLLELQMEELVPYFCKMAMVTNGYLNLDAFECQVTIRIEILAITAFKLSPCLDHLKMI
jgi:hypothetical protein